MKNWVLDSSWFDPESSYSVNMDGDHELIAVFEEEPLTKPIVESCNLDGSQKDVCDLSEDLHVKGSDFLASSDFEVYVVDYVEVRSDRMPIPYRVPGTLEMLLSNAESDVPPTNVWSNLQAYGFQRPEPGQGRNAQSNQQADDTGRACSRQGRDALYCPARLGEVGRCCVPILIVCRVRPG